MDQARLLVVAAMLVVLAAWLMRIVVVGLLTGSIRHSDLNSKCSRHSRPLRYWFLVVIFTAFAVLSLWIVIITVGRMVVT